MLGDLVLVAVAAGGVCDRGRRTAIADVGYGRGGAPRRRDGSFHQRRVSAATCAIRNAAARLAAGRFARRCTSGFARGGTGRFAGGLGTAGRARVAATAAAAAKERSEQALALGPATIPREADFAARSAAARTGEIPAIVARLATWRIFGVGTPIGATAALAASQTATAGLEKREQQQSADGGVTIHRNVPLTHGTNA